MSAPATMGYAGALAWNDVVIGFAAVALGLANLVKRRAAFDWILCLAGSWLLFAPLVFWTTSAAAYASDTAAGILLVVFSVILPVRGRDDGPEIPAGWSYNPGSWRNRAPIIGLALFGFFIARYMAAYQLGHIAWVWDPLFDDGTERILTSEISKAFPIADAGLGASAYLLEALAGMTGDRNRWRTMPWMVLLFVVLVVPTGTVSVVLVVLQPVAVGTWCALCLITAISTVFMVPLALDEFAGTVQFVWRRVRGGAPLLRTLAIGDREEPGPAQEDPVALAKNKTWFPFTPPWNMVVSVLAGFWLMAAPDILDIAGRAADSARIVGALAVTFSVIAFAEVSRPVRYLNALLGLWSIAAPWVFGAPAAALWSDTLAGLVLIALAFRRGRIDERHGAWDKALAA